MKVVSMTFSLQKDVENYKHSAEVRADLKEDGTWSVSVYPPRILESMNLSTADLDAALEQITQMRQFVERVQGILEP